MTMHCLIFGFGYTAKALAPKLIAQGMSVSGTSRMLNQKMLDDQGVQRISFDDGTGLDQQMRTATHLLICIPPNHDQSDDVLKYHRDRIQQNANHLQWIGYLSSTSVYGDHQGRWVTEKSACTPHTAFGIARLHAEQAWVQFATEHQLPLHIFRLSGIYGPGRNALERLNRGQIQSIVKDNQVFCRIHVDDIVATILASMRSPHPLSIYNVSDDEPAPSHRVDAYAAQLMHKDPPRLIPYAEADLSPMVQEFYANHRRVSNLKMKTELGVRLTYPTYQEGLSHLWSIFFKER